MQAYPVQGANIAQMMFYQNEKSVVPSHSISAAYQNLSALSGINSLPQENNDMKTLMPAYLQQAHLSTYYQDNPWAILTASNKYGTPTMGGELDPNLPPGYKPGNTLRNSNSDLRMPKYNMPMVPKVPSNNMPKVGGREHFGNDDSDSIKISWQ